MAISTIGNITYINQNMQTTSANHANAMQRGDMIPQEFEDKLKEIQEVRPTETNNKVDKDSKGNQNWGEEESKKEPKDANEEDSTESSTQDFAHVNGTHLLNIKV